MYIEFYFNDLHMKIPLWLPALALVILTLLKLMEMATITWLIVLSPILAWIGIFVLLFLLVITVNFFKKLFR